MKILFLVYHGFSEVSGISKKIHYQVKGLVRMAMKFICAIMTLIKTATVVAMSMMR